MVFALFPIATQVIVPEPEEHVRVLPAVVKAGPAVKVRDPKILVGYGRVHCSPDGGAVVGAVSVKLIDRAAPRVPLTLDKVNAA